MKRLLSAILAITLLLSLTACGSKDPETPPESSGSAQVQGSTPSEKAPEKEAEKGPEQLPEKEPEAPPAVRPLRVVKGGSYVSEWDDDFNELCSVEWEVLALAEEYPGLSAALEEVNIDQAADSSGFLQEWLPLAQEDLALTPEYFGGYTSTSEYSIWRADSRVLSIREDFSSYTGGAHGYYGVWGRNFDTATGAQLGLADVLTETDGLDKILVEKLREKYPEEPFPDLEEKLQGYAPEDYCWTLGYQGITVYFNPYEIAAYASGLLTVTLWFDEMPQLFREEYMAVPESGWVVGIPYWNEIEVDLTPDDGARDTLSCWTQEDEYGWKSLVLSLNGNEYWEESWQGFSMTLYLICADGNFYLYAEGQAENDYRTAYIYDLSGESVELIFEFSGAGFTGYWDETAGSDGVYFYDVFTDPTDFVLGSVCHLLGTKTAVRTYSIDPANGALIPEEEVYRFNKEPAPIVSAIALDVIMLPENKVETLPAGTEFVCLRTDNENWMELALTDGRECRIEIEEIDWTPTINGIPEWECFEELFYAG